MPSFLDAPEYKPEAQPVRRLAELFYDRFFYNDLISSHDDPQLAASNMMAILIFPGVLCLYLIPKYHFELARATLAERELSILGDRFLWLSFEMAVLGLLTTLQWERLFPDRRDYMILGPQPISMRLLFEAQARALGRFLAVFLLAVNWGSALFFPIATAPNSASLLQGLGMALGHWTSIVAAGIFAVLMVVALQGVLTNLLPPELFDRVSPVVQSALGAGFLGVIVLLPLLSMRLTAGVDSVEQLVTKNPSAWSLPPLWFAALGGWMAGGSPLLAPIAGWAALAFLTAAVVALGTYLLSYRRFLRRSLESAGQSRAGNSWAASAVRAALARTWVKDPSERAAFFFTLWTISRSRQHRLYLGAFLSVGVAVAAAQTWFVRNFEAPSEMLLSQPYLLLFLALAGLKAIFAIPAELPANVAFRSHAAAPVEVYMRGTRKAVWAAAALPLLCVSTFVAALLWGIAAALVHALVLFMAAWISIEVMLARYWRIPFTCNYVAGRPHVIIIWTFCAIGALAYSSFLAGIELWAMESFPRAAALAAATATVAAVWPRYRPAPDEFSTTLVFEEPSDLVVYRLNLHD